MKKRIVIEGFWNIGKTSLSEYFKNNFGYEIIPEPLHKNVELESQDKVNQWYVNQHSKRQEMLCSSDCQKGCVMERSIISSAAFKYATATEKGEEESTLIDLRECYRDKGLVVVFLYAPFEYLENNVRSIEDDEVKKLYKTEGFLERYYYFYTHKLPFEYDITPLSLNVLDEDGDLRTIEQISGDVVSAVKENRLAQVNVVCKKKINNQNKYLVLKRNQEKGGFWQTVTGGVEISELLSIAAQREVEEELNLNSSDVLQVYPTDYTFSYIGGEGYELHEYVYGCELREGTDISLSDEHTKHEWLSVEEAAEKVKYEGNRQSILEVSTQEK